MKKLLPIFIITFVFLIFSGNEAYADYYGMYDGRYEVELEPGETLIIEKVAKPTELAPPLMLVHYLVIPEGEQNWTMRMGVLDTWGNIITNNELYKTTTRISDKSAQLVYDHLDAYSGYLGYELTNKSKTKATYRIAVSYAFDN